MAFMKCPYDSSIECEYDYHTPLCFISDRSCPVEYKARYPEEWAEKKRKEAEEREEALRKAKIRHTVTTIVAWTIVVIVTVLIFIFL